MESLKNILTEITQLTLYIETNYPELYRDLNENPMTLPITSHPHIDKKVMQEYLESLKDLIQRHLETYKIETEQRK
ncbi:hypothetical protein [Winogradskyella thalassocola]|uniref:Uncharacterized protein n=1 Tax=Winogradskyella thalassocola TaxID=262004 RepID=A0A1G8BDV1_9FLAO|nr:hypothetical protein [Winogradskyella thalassocola]SDH31405.1 hypothetical protein SAMN04489796_102310 [Winogradskyella thalassocola]